ncbi:MAG: AbiH family protein [Chitinophagaceae bacterium]
MDLLNRIVLIGNGFDLAHGLPTTYRDFIDWYMREAFDCFRKGTSYNDKLVELKYKYAGSITQFRPAKTLEEVVQMMASNSYQSINYKSKFFEHLIQLFYSGSWVNIEREYYQQLIKIFDNEPSTIEAIKLLNTEFDFMIEKLADFFKIVNAQMGDYKKLNFGGKNTNISKAFAQNAVAPVSFINFNYTDTLITHNYAYEHEVIYIHGRAAQMENNPIIFGYGDETDSNYQKLENHGDDNCLNHIKSFAYLKTENYQKVMSLIDSDPYVVYIVGHSCGLSDRILLSEIFEHKNCNRIEIFYHQRPDRSDNFKEITQEISRHFKPANKGLMRRRVSYKDSNNVIPQNLSI